MTNKILRHPTLPIARSPRRHALASLLAGVALSAATAVSVADDTDIYINPAVPVTDQPLVMFTLDYRPNLMGRGADPETEAFFNGAPYDLDADIAELKNINGGGLNYFDQLYLSLVAVLQSVEGVKVGLMMSHNTGGPDGYQGQSPANNNRDSNGGVVLYGFNTLNDASTLADFKAKLLAVKRMNTGSNAADHSYQGAEIFFEFFRYLTGQAIHNGHNGYVDYEKGGGVDLSTNMRCQNGDPKLVRACYDSNIETSEANNNPASTPPLYISPFSTARSCAKVFTINFLFQVSNQDNDSNTAAGKPRLQGGLGFTPGNNTALNDVLAFLRDTDLAEDPELDEDSIGEAFGPADSQPELAGKQNVTSFFVSEKANVTTNGYAVAGGTDAVIELGGSPQQMINTLTNIFQQILSVSTTFVAASVPVNVFNRAEIVDNVYFALFQAEKKARWQGNLKKLRLATEDVFDTSTPPQKVGTRFRIVDNAPTPQDAIGAADGRIIPNALTYWSDNAGTLLDVGDSNGDGVVDAKDTGTDGVADNVDSDTGQVTFPTPSTGTDANPKDYVTDRDGRHIPRGGAGQKIPSFRVTAGPGDSNPVAGTPAGSDAPPAAGPRKIFYLSSSSTSASLQPLDAVAAPSAELKTQLGNSTMTDAEAQKLLRYARGQDAADEDADCAADDADPASACRTESRYWMQGDPLHSRPLPINYGAGRPEATLTSVPDGLGHQSKKNPAIFIAMASNDGHLRLFRNTAGTASDTDTPAELGQEVWTFIPPEGLGVQKRLFDNSTPAGESPHPYSFDGEATALILDLNGNGVIECTSACDGAADDDRVILYIGLRRGGSAYYSLDITDPLNPKFLWSVRPGFRTTASGGQQATTDFDELGQTFSRPRIGRLNLGVEEFPSGSGVFRPRNRLAVFFGGGYDGGYALSGGSTIRLGKDRAGVMDDDTKGKAIFSVRANDGSLIWKGVGGTGTNTSKVFYHANLKDSIPSNLTLVDSDADGNHDRIYVGDTGGNLWRVDMGPDSDGTTNPDQSQVTDDWKMTRLACLGRHSGSSCATITTRLEDRRFFHEPDVVQAADADGRFDAVVIGSGDRPDPLDKGGDVDNWFYMIKDRNTQIGSATDAVRTHGDLSDVTNQCIEGSSSCTINGEGWRLALDNPNGEKALSAPVTIANSIFFTTYLPPGASSNSCGPGEGGGFLYALKLGTGEPARNYNTADGPAQEDGSGTTDSDRQRDLETPGIPAQVVYLGTPPGGGGSGAACTVNILAGARILEAPGCPRFRTFWQRTGN